MDNADVPYTQAELEQFVTHLIKLGQWPYDGPGFRTYRIQGVYVSVTVIESATVISYS